MVADPESCHNASLVSASSSGPHSSRLLELSLFQTRRPAERLQVWPLLVSSAMWSVHLSSLIFWTPRVVSHKSPVELFALFASRGKSWPIRKCIQPHDTLSECSSLLKEPCCCCVCSPSWLDDFKDYGLTPEDGDSLNCAQIVTLAKLGIFTAPQCNDLKVELAPQKCCGAAAAASPPAGK
jgi:hypothetical protein